ncbi:Fpg/Nei family DNA glycosylase [Brevibacillus porteri]|uniref:Formamidopyrimidine-DNA glycosylase n=1 Tax=Brevibacillus porteri TaxID=2126350 RepID=A0ABX5FT48_9BACL|nr:DNA-formamidopyrimidine glycosylase family protein [Brevibacillus porteri]MED1800347.1 DNA-formamidopyrimidine glycosylase family protein [Brevibacillus porteri]MED2134072.1 DNA-formamidopyrimidine glycosylase family protein [Brevibacillus porteri]MED2745802.1 DNA-formamidopyrimidine glycosylase family protein [Brevibacillus porteri]MED2813016.1 DNA-formamidopyrimidine glycosylase family protein [Brevibacillus porteri]MED2893290.1 DNA-formamidopyrimidine glycosylase family protein [Brevibac
MPELPEMETYRRLLQEKIGGGTITATHVQREKTINLPPAEFARLLQGNRLTLVDRRGKHLLFHLESGHVLLLHLMLGGFLYLGSAEDKLKRTAQVTLAFDERILYFHGLRLGYLHLLTNVQIDERLAPLGPEPLDPLFTFPRFTELLTDKRSVLKTALVNQHLLAGIGNCYADEICFQAAILPTRTIPTLSFEEQKQLYHSMQTVLTEAIRFGGYMQPLFSGDSLTGGFDERCQVYDRGGEPCPRCGQPIEKSELSSRKVFACTNCQH